MGTDYAELAIKAAKYSPCKKRRVGATVVGTGSNYMSAYNRAIDDGQCEDEEGRTRHEVMHAEIEALTAFRVEFPDDSPHAIYITHQPCSSCRTAILEAGIMEQHIHVVEEFMKFDELKARLDLLPESICNFVSAASLFGEWYNMFKKRRTMPSQTEDDLIALGYTVLKHTSIKEVGEILAHGAKKYKPNNWRNCKDTDRYWVALGRHILDMESEGVDSIDPDSGLKHAAHAMCNIVFILELDAVIPF